MIAAGKVVRDEPVRAYVVNLLEYEPPASFHIHAETFDVYPAGMGETPTFRDDTIALTQGQRADDRAHPSSLWEIHVPPPSALAGRARVDGLVRRDLGGIEFRDLVTYGHGTWLDYEGVDPAESVFPADTHIDESEGL